MRQTKKLWVLAATLFCGFSCTSCIDDLEDNPVTPEPVVSAHFINVTGGQLYLAPEKRVRIW